ncbi:hypothetical protein ACTA71_005400 [Dictyostelium dimigraforme]
MTSNNNNGESTQRVSSIVAKFKDPSSFSLSSSLKKSSLLFGNYSIFTCAHNNYFPLHQFVNSCKTKEVAMFMVEKLGYSFKETILNDILNNQKINNWKSIIYPIIYARCIQSKTISDLLSPNRIQIFDKSSRINLSLFNIINKPITKSI